MPNPRSAPNSVAPQSPAALIHTCVIYFSCTRVVLLSKLLFFLYMTKRMLQLCSSVVYGFCFLNFSNLGLYNCAG